MIIAMIKPAKKKSVPPPWPNAPVFFSVSMYRLDDR
jgi:hypothetical protein